MRAHTRAFRQHLRRACAACHRSQGTLRGPGYGWISRGRCSGSGRREGFAAGALFYQWWQPCSAATRSGALIVADHNLIFCGVCYLELIKLKFKLLDLAKDLLALDSEEHAPKLVDRKLEMSDLCGARSEMCGVLIVLSEVLLVLCKEKRLQGLVIEGIQIRQRGRALECDMVSLRFRIARDTGADTCGATQPLGSETCRGVASEDRCIGSRRCCRKEGKALRR